MRTGVGNQPGSILVKDAMRHALIAAMCLAAAACTGSPHKSSVVGGSARSLSHPVTASGGSRVISYQGVQIHLPAGWPVMDGNKTPLCSSPWSAEPTVYVGIQPLASVGCGPPATPHSTLAPSYLNGIWLQVQTPVSDQGSKVVGYKLPSGQVVQEVRPLSTGPGADLLFHNVWIEVGPATSPPDADQVLASLAYHHGASDSTVPGGCAINPTYDEMPTATRLAQRLLIGGGSMDPPLPTDRPVVPASIAWHNPESSPLLLPTENYRLFLARYTGGGRTLEPKGWVTTNDNVLAWVLYSSPVTPTPSCGFSSYGAYGALTGQGLGGASGGRL
jgi:hypothetical protein